jgi:2-amino-4-hydroxy-6-hydroxymethyldihydropteridine diphosphokinase
VFVGLGSNLGDREKALRSGIEGLSRLGRMVRISSLYQTAPWGKLDQPPYLNCAVELEPALKSPDEFLSELQEIEQSVGRPVQRQKWEPRVLDLDILFWGVEVINADTLQIPHPLIEKRRFVLIPLKEIAPDFIHPIIGKSISELLDECPDRLQVSIYNNPSKSNRSLYKKL